MAASQLIRIPVVRNPNYVANGTKSLVHMMHKYSIEPTIGRYQRRGQSLVRRQDDGSTAPIPSEDSHQDAYYLCPVQIGNPAQTLHLNFDSGSADYWVWSTLLPQRVQDRGRANGAVFFDPTQSSTFETLTGASWTITYGDQSSASGTVGTDRLQIGNIVVDSQHIELAVRLSSSLQTQPDCHGLLGLAFGHINTVRPVKVNTPLENMIARQDIPLPLFTAYLGSFKDVADPDKGESFYTFGGIDQSVIEASGQEIHYVPIDNSQGFWAFAAPSLVVNGQVINTPGNTAIADTGTTLMLVADSVCEAIYSNIPGAHFDTKIDAWVYPAETPAEHFPVLQFLVGDKPFTIEKEHIGFTTVDDSGTMIYGGIQSRGHLLFDIWGDTFLKCVYAIFDAGNLQFGVVQRADPTPDNVAFPPQ